LAELLLPKTQNERDLHAARLAKFYAQVDDKRAEWRTIRTYEDVHELREYALVIGKDWRGYTPLAAAQGKVDAGPVEIESRLRDDQLGRLGREPQHSAIKMLLSSLAAYPEVPAVAVLVHGDKDQGQWAFVAYVLDSLLKSYRPKRRIGRLPPGNSALEALVAWVAGTLGLTNISSVDTPEVLAERVVEELKHQQLYFVIDRVGADYTGGVPAFQETFWQPFWTRLKSVRSQQQIANRLVAIVTDYSGDAGNWTGVAVDAKPGVPIDFSKLTKVPPLSHIAEGDSLRLVRRS
jgi:inactive STAND